MPTYFIKNFIKLKRRDWSNQIVETVAPLTSWRLSHWSRRVQKYTFWSFGQNFKRFLVKYFNPKIIKKGKNRIPFGPYHSQNCEISWLVVAEKIKSKVFDVIYKNLM